MTRRLFKLEEKRLFVQTNVSFHWKKIVYFLMIKKKLYEILEFTLYSKFELK